MKPYKYLLDRLPLVKKMFSPEHMETIAVKWGARDGSYHSAKSAIKQLSSKMTEDEVKTLELQVESAIDQAIESLFRCEYCGVDMQKSGLSSMVTGYQTAKSFISSDGQITRETEILFSRDTFKGVAPYRYQCLGCGNNLRENNTVVYFITHGINANTILNFMGINSQTKRHKDDELYGLSTDQILRTNRIIPRPIAIDPGMFHAGTNPNINMDWTTIMPDNSETTNG